MFGSASILERCTPLHSKHQLVDWNEATELTRISFDFKSRVNSRPILSTPSSARTLRCRAILAPPVSAWLSLPSTEAAFTAKLANGLSCMAELPPAGMTSGCFGGAGGLYPSGSIREVTPPAAEEITKGIGGKGASSSPLGTVRRLAAYGRGVGDRSAVGGAYWREGRVFD